MFQNSRPPLMVKIILAVWVLLALFMFLASLAAPFADQPLTEKLDILLPPIILLAAVVYIWRTARR